MNLKGPTAGHGLMNDELLQDYHRDDEVWSPGALLKFISSLGSYRSFCHWHAVGLFNLMDGIWPKKNNGRLALCSYPVLLD